jgi:hypothetical protein
VYVFGPADMRYAVRGLPPEVYYKTLAGLWEAVGRYPVVQMLESDDPFQEVSRVSALVGGFSRQPAVSPPDLLFALSMATLVHGFYSGVERILTAIEKETRGALPSG